MYKILLIVFLLFACISYSTCAQTSTLSTNSKKAQTLYYKADEYAKARNFDKALEALSEATEKDPAFAEAYLKAASLTRSLGDKAATFEYLEKGLSLVPYNPALQNSYFDLAELHFERGNYEQSKKYYHDFLNSKPRNPKLVDLARQQVRTIDYALKAMLNPVEFNPVQLPGVINQFELQYFPATTADQRHFIYTARISARPDQDENIYVSQWQEGAWQTPVSISENINSNANEGAATISGDGKTLVFTSCNRPDSQGDCDLYISFRTGNEWSKPKNMGYTVNSRAWESQPGLSADGRTLYLTSNRSGGKGKEDIWVTHMREDGSWEKPVNVGAPINTTGRDMSPFVHASGTTLYFVSDGHQGMGGLDVFKTALQPDRRWTEPENMGYPLNTHADEGSLFITPDNKTGYYSRKMITDTGSPSILLFGFDVPEVWKSKEESTYAQGRVFDNKTKKPIEAVVQLYDIRADSLVQQVNSDKVTGEYTAVLAEGKKYALYVTAPGYMMNSLSFDYTSSKALTPLALDVYLDPIGTGAAVVLNNLFFNSGEYTLEQDSKTELNKLISFLRQNKDLKIEIAGHTDDVGSDSANQLLSEKRAESVADYLAGKGISEGRLQAKGYGETKPKAPNTSGENRSLNRRIEMRVL